MRSPGVVCAGCGEPTTGINAICDKCPTPPGVSDPLIERCALCEAGLATDKHGYYHLTKAGGYAGKCAAMTADSIGGDA